MLHWHNWNVNRYLSDNRKELLLRRRLVLILVDDQEYK